MEIEYTKKKKGKFKIGHKEYKLAINSANNALHGGQTGFHSRMWSVDSRINTKEKLGVTLKYMSKDMEEGYPGELIVM